MKTLRTHIIAGSTALFVALAPLIVLAGPGDFPDGTPPNEVWEGVYDTDDPVNDNRQVILEVKFLTVDDEFFQRIWVDFDFNVNVSTLPIRPIDVPDGVNFIQSSFPSVPHNPFDFPFSVQGSALPAKFGYAVLDDIEAFLFLRGAQGDKRTDIQVAPQVTLFNGQVCNITAPDTKTKYFALIVKQGSGVTIKPLVSDDDQFVRLDLLPVLHGFGVTPYPGPPQGEPDKTKVKENVFVQQPTFAYAQIATTVTVPDGGTVLLGGIKPLPDNKYGVPVLARVPYITRLFYNPKNPNKSTSLMLMVTPRVIILED